MSETMVETTKRTYAKNVLTIEDMKPAAASNEDRIVPERAYGGGRTRDEHQLFVDAEYQKSVDTGDFVTLTGPLAEGVAAELVRRIKNSARQANLSVQFGNIREHNGRIRVPFLAVEKREYKKSEQS